MELNPEQILIEQHKTWLNHPATCQLIANLEKFKMTFSTSMSANASNFDVPNDMFRLNAFGIRTTDAIIQQIKRTETFIEQSKK